MRLALALTSDHNSDGICIQARPMHLWPGNLVRTRPNWLNMIPWHVRRSTQQKFFEKSTVNPGSLFVWLFSCLSLHQLQRVSLGSYNCVRSKQRQTNLRRARQVWIWSEGTQRFRINVLDFFLSTVRCFAVKRCCFGFQNIGKLVKAAGRQEAVARLEKALAPHEAQTTSAGPACFP